MKPSDYIKNKAVEKMKHGIGGRQSWDESIIEYLDEQHEKEQK